MVSSGRFTLLFFNSVAVLVGAAVMYGLYRSVGSELLKPKETEIARFFAPYSPPQAHRLAFAPPGGLSTPEPLAELPLPYPSPSAGTAPQSGSGSWSTETRLETAPPSGWRFAMLPPLRSPSQIVKPDTKRRTYSLKARLEEISPTAIVRLAAKFEAAKAVWPPAEIVLVAIKDEKVLELHARPSGGAWQLIHRYRVLAASGGAGPKLRQGDKQVPEGLYSIAFLNPNSAYHVSLRVNYPNAFDRQMAAKDGRKELGGDIMIHGKNLSAGCLAMGDEAVEELFVLAAQTGLPNVKLIIAPTDFRQKGLPAAEPGQPEWLPKLYAEVATAMADFKAPRSTGLLSFFFK